ncbi:MAG: YbaY family lipoprotein, partial [Chloroflexi bacterium]|nr:YbaY family lipoprotein [Chloroflexota bacterium]
MKNKGGIGLVALGGFLLLAAAVACGSEPETAAPADTGRVGIQPTATPEEVTKPVVTGTVTYRERIALSPDAVVTVKLLDVSRADAPAITLSEQIIDNPGQVPVAFELPYDPTEIDDRFTYVVRAEIREGGELVFTTTTSYPVITRGSPATAELVLASVPGAPPVRDDGPAAAEPLCVSTAILQTPIEFVHPGDAISTAFDGVNTANCTFPELIESVTVVIINAETGAIHTQVFSMVDRSDMVSFPLDEGASSLGTLDALEPGEYERMLQAVALGGNVYELTGRQGALARVTVLPGEVAAPEVICMLTRAAQLPIAFTQAGDAISTAFDGINVANCTFPEEIESVTVVITNVET